jgi:fructose/tagatose bisphosphate aldolase
MAEIASRRLRDPAAELDRSAPAHGYGNDKANRFTKSSEFDAKRPSSRQHDHYIIGVPIDAVPRGAGHDFRKANIDCRLVTTAAFRRVAKTKPGAFDPRKLVRVGRGRMRDLGRRRFAQFESPRKRPRSRFFPCSPGPSSS